MYYKFTEQTPAGTRKLKYEAVLIEALSREEAVEILLEEFPNEELEAASFEIEEAKDITRAKPMLDSVKSFIIIHSARKVKDVSK